MDLTQIVRENANARKIIAEMNLADIVKKFGVSFADAKKLQNYVSLLEMVD